MRYRQSCAALARQCVCGASTSHSERFDLLQLPAGQPDRVSIHMRNGGAFVISLDFELRWGVRDKRTIADYGRNS
jgi:hypothetical protein